MADYGHDIQFGTFITPSNMEPQLPVDLAVLTEDEGLDLVTFQDHPYQPRFHDTWTLLSYAAARTSTVRLAANVHCLPLRHPAVLARSATSLDLLSGGRFELGLGAGAFWDAIEAMGGPRRSPGEAVDALNEAIHIIRGIWDTDTRGGLRLDGTHYRLSGAKRGPKPVHDISIWLGANRPRMQRLIGRIGDGWLPSLPMGSVDLLVTGNEVIDAAAAEAGRDPAEIRRLVNIGTDIPAEQIADLAVTLGFSTFIVMTDDPDQIRRLARELAPAVRELVAAVRSGQAEIDGDQPT
jgi:alkanesulfonate monooxygenase SsuD/methylene tetrahydromethanopterin reductase-like flavin-dependent oxidoreductase (luciferase family)